MIKTLKVLLLWTNSSSCKLPSAKYNHLKPNQRLHRLNHQDVRGFHTKLFLLLSNLSYFLFLAIIECAFENDACQWTILTDDETEKFKWTRKSAEELEGLPAPSGDYENNAKPHFMIASNALAGSEAPQKAVTKLESPYFSGLQHPVECFSFWFYFGVKAHNLHILSNEIVTMLFLYSLKVQKKC